MKENERRLQEWKQQEQSKKTTSNNTNCEKCGKPLEGETVELEAIHKEWHKR